MVLYGGYCADAPMKPLAVLKRFSGDLPSVISTLCRPSPPRSFACPHQGAVVPTLVTTMAPRLHAMLACRENACSVHVYRTKIVQRSA